MHNSNTRSKTIKKKLNKCKNIFFAYSNLQFTYGNILDSSIVFIQDSKEISTHGTVYKTVNWSVLKPKQQALAGDFCLYDKNTDKLTIVSQSEDLSNYSSDRYTPVGVVVVPSSHNVYGDGSCGVMSIKAMHCTTPSTGSDSEQGIYWGVYGTDISTLNNLNVVCYVGSDGSVNETVQGKTSSAYLPSDKFSTVPNTYDTKTSYYYNNRGKYIPSPYKNDGTYNFAYSQTSSPSSSNNAIADFNGKSNTDNIITQRGTKDYTSWKPTYNTPTDYPAASCCDMFYTEGTKQGDWYLPALGELGYIVPRFNAINASINNLKNIYGVGVQLSSTNCYWSSSEYSSYFARDVRTLDGLVSHNDKIYYGNYVRAFLRVKP